MQKITSCLWFDNQAEEAVNYYISIFKNSEIQKISYYGKAAAKASGMPEGSVLTITFRLNGQEFMALNGGPVFKFTEAISLMVNCKDQEEVDYYWEKLSSGGDKAAQQCGWLKDKYGLSWQVVPEILGEMITGKDSEKSERVMQAMLQMKKIDIDALRKAYA